MNVSFRQLRVFTEVARHLSFVRAAEALQGGNQGLRSREDQEVRIRSKKAPRFESGLAREEGGRPGGFDRKPGLDQPLGRGQLRGHVEGADANPSAIDVADEVHRVEQIGAHAVGHRGGGRGPASAG